MSNGNLKKTSLVSILLFGTLCGLAQERTSLPKVFLIDAHQLQSVKRGLGDKRFETAVAKIEADAKKLLSQSPYTVVSKGVVPPSGDKHDYMSQAPYFWADPKSANGLPYIRRDGERNPEINKITDHESMDRMTNAVETLALAYYLKGDEAYANKAVQFLRAWFLDPATRMNPNLQYAQGIPGVTTGRGIGLIESHGLARVTDAIGLLDGSKELTNADKQGIKDWFGKFLQWVLESKNGREEAAAKNNHGSWYDVQTAAFALFLGKRDLAQQIIENAKTKRIAAQIEPDGRMPLELERTRSWHYSIYNLDGLMQLATLGEAVGVDLWGFQTTDGRGIRRAIEYLYPFSVGEKWQFKELGEWEPQALFPSMRAASAKYRDDKFQAMMAKVPSADISGRENLVLAKY